MPIVLPKTPDVEIMKMLIKANHFLNHAQQHSYAGNDFDIMIAIHNLDNAIEYLLRIIIRHLEIEEMTGKTINTCELSQLIGEIQKFLKDNTDCFLSYVQEIKMVRELRNMVQHAMVLPISELNTYMIYGHKFFKKTLSKIFGIDISDIRYSTLIDNEHIKSQILHAENHIDSGEYLKSVVSSRNAFEYAVFIYNFDSGQRINRAPVLSQLREKDSSLYHYLKKLDIKIEFDSIGIDIKKYLRFNEYIEHIPHEYVTDWHSNSVLNRDWEKSDADFCYNFAVTAILSLQLGKMQSIDTPDLDFSANIFTTKINELEVKENFETYGCIYAFGDMLARLFYTNEETITPLKDILKNNIVKWSDITKSEISEISHHEAYVRIQSYDIQVVINDPAVWEVIICYEEIPFTGKWLISHENTEIENLDKKQIVQLGYSEDIANKVCSFLDANKEIDTVDKAFELHGIFQQEYVSVNLFSSKLLDILNS